MKAITVRQPWAWAILHGGKDVENRTRNIAGKYRGPLVIHAGLAPFEQDNLASREHRRLHGSEAPTVIHFGAALGIVDLVDAHRGDCITIETYREGHEQRVQTCSLWAELTSHHLVLANPRPFATPIPYRGQLGLWEFPDDLLPEEYRAGWGQP